jgi:putative transposase
VKPATILNFHRALKARKYRFLFPSTRRKKPGPKEPALELIQAIVEMKRRNPRYGCPRIAQQLSAVFGITINKDVVRRVLATHYRPDPDAGGLSWLTFLGQMKDSLWSIDLFRCESILLKTHWVLVVMDQFTRRIIGFGVHRGEVDGAALCHMFTKATTGRSIPTFLSSDHHPVFTSHCWKATVQGLGIKEIKTIPYVPVSHPFVERLIGTIRREYLEQVLFWNARDVERKLEAFTDYYNRHRVHSSLQGQTPAARSGEPGPCRAELTHFTWQQHCQGLFQTPMAA